MESEGRTDMQKTNDVRTDKANLRPVVFAYNKDEGATYFKYRIYKETLENGQVKYYMGAEDAFEDTVSLFCERLPDGKEICHNAYGVMPKHLDQCHSANFYPTSGKFVTEFIGYGSEFTFLHGRLAEERIGEKKYKYTYHENGQLNEKRLIGINSLYWAYEDATNYWEELLEKYDSDGKLRYKKGEYAEYPNGMVEYEKLEDGRIVHYQNDSNHSIKRVEFPDGKEVSYKTTHEARARERKDLGGYLIWYNPRGETSVSSLYDYMPYNSKKAEDFLSQAKMNSNIPSEYIKAETHQIRKESYTDEKGNRVEDIYVDDKLRYNKCGQNKTRWDAEGNVIDFTSEDRTGGTTHVMYAINDKGERYIAFFKHCNKDGRNDTEQYLAALQVKKNIAAKRLAYEQQEGVTLQKMSKLEKAVATVFKNKEKMTLVERFLAKKAGRSADK